MHSAHAQHFPSRPITNESLRMALLLFQFSPVPLHFLFTTIWFLIHGFDGEFPFKPRTWPTHINLSAIRFRVMWECKPKASRDLGIVSRWKLANEQEHWASTEQHQWCRCTHFIQRRCVCRTITIYYSISLGQWWKEHTLRINHVRKYYFYIFCFLVNFHDGHWTYAGIWTKAIQTGHKKTEITVGQ